MKAYPREDQDTPGGGLHNVGAAGILTWRFYILHVSNENSPRRGEMIPPKFHLIPPKNFFVPTWKMKNSHVEI